MTQTLSEALTKEHTDIDAGIEAFLAGRDAGRPSTDGMLAAIAAQRRHIYLEEAILFPPLRQAGMFAPVMVMLMEHGRMWQVMEALEPLLRDGATDPQVSELCQQLVDLLAAHNPKEEQILYPQADTALEWPASAQLKEFLESGEMPDGWVCEKG
jgi:iron-sulfur cluster repair protein YtfE (RIC family)